MEEGALLQELICSLEESIVHTHTQDCISITETETLLCTLPEHSHSSVCQSDSQSDLETAEDWESTIAPVTLSGFWPDDLASIARSQLGYRESTVNYINEDGQSPKGYTRYGAWYGTPYANWNALFTSFCLHYANIPEDAIPRNPHSDLWLDTLDQAGILSPAGQYTPKSGDLVFFTQEGDSQIYSGIVSTVEYETDPVTGASSPDVFRVIAGDLNDSVTELYLSPDELLRSCNIERIQLSYDSTVGISDSSDITDTTPSVSFFSNSGGIAAIAESAEVTLAFYSYNEWCPINFPTGNNYTCSVGSTVTVILQDSAAGYYTPNLTLNGATLVSQSYSCGTAGCNHSNWCGTAPVHTLVFQITSSTANITGFVDGANWSSSTVTVSDSGGGTTDPTDPTETTPPTETTAPTEETKPGSSVTDYPTTENYPDAVYTGDIHIDRLRFYNLCDDGSNGVDALPGCVFEITGTTSDGQPYHTTLTSDSNPQIALPDNIPDGVFTITEVSVPDGYIRDINHTREFWIQGGALQSEHNIGTFINHSTEKLSSDKTAEVTDYDSRIYQVLLNAESNMKMYQMEPIDVIFVVDKSNSMLFPSGLDPIGKSLTLRKDGTNNISGNKAVLDSLDKTKVHYIIADPQGSATVYAIWYDGTTWIYQDASYYAKASHDNGPGYESGNEIAIFPGNRSYSEQVDWDAAYEERTGVNVRANGGALDKDFGTSSLGNDINKESNATKTYQLYTAQDEYNRLHYLEEALSNMIYELADANPKNRITLVPFTKTVQTQIEYPENSGSYVNMPVELTTSNAEMLVNIVTNINTTGGTRQDLALKYTLDEYLSSGKLNRGSDHTYTILITDGAPVKSDDKELPDIYSDIRTYGNQVGNEETGKSTLMTVALGMDNVETGKSVLQEIATGDEFYCALDDASELVESMQKILFESMIPQENIVTYGDVVDEISDSFYPIAWVDAGQGAATDRQVLVQDTARDWVLLHCGDWITLDGKFTTEGASDAAGKLQRREDGTFYIQWNNVRLSDPNGDLDPTRIGWVTAGNGSNTGRTVVDSYDGKDWIVLNEGDYINSNGQYVTGGSWWDRRSYGQVTLSSTGDYSITWGDWSTPANRQLYQSSFSGWKGTFYLKAKEDFIGGNAINTNKSAGISLHGAYKPLETPTVNVRLLDLNEFSSEVTVYLGDTVNGNGSAPLDQLKQFYENTKFTKLESGTGDVLNALATADGLEEAAFYLRYAIGRDLTADEWSALENGTTITIPYVYDNPSSRGPVGYFTFRLEKTGMDGATLDFGEHTATASCQPGGYPLSANCAAPAETYSLKISYTAYRLGEEGRPSANVHNSGTGPGTEVGIGETLETGLGTIARSNTHEVHVISGSITITKHFDTGITSDTDQTFTFILHRLEDGTDTTGDVSKTITIPAGSSSGSASISFAPLSRGTYTVTEAANDSYTVKQISVLPTTNCFSTPSPGTSAGAVTFVMGQNLQGEDVIGKYSETDEFTSYIHSSYGVYGAAEFTNTEIVYTAQLPVQKVWSDGESNHELEQLYVVLYEGDSPVLDTDGNARLLRLSADNNWTDTFLVPLSGKDDTLSNYDYSVREVSQVKSDPIYQWHSAIEEHTGMLLYYEQALESGQQLSLNSHGYLVEYTPGANNGWVVTNHLTVALPHTGSTLTSLHYTFGGLLILAVALMYHCITGRNRRKEGR